MVFVWGDAATPVYPRSAIKALQALPLVESGAARRLRLRRRRARARLRLAQRRSRTRCGRRPDAHLRRRRPGRPRLRRALALRAVEPDRARALRGHAERAPQQLLGQACGLPRARAPARVPARGLRHRRSPRAGRGPRRRRGHDRRGLGTDVCGTDWLLDPDLRDPARPARARLRPVRHRAGAAGAARRGGAPAARRGRGASGHGGGRRALLHADHATSGSARFVKTGAEGVFCASLPISASASRSNATTGRCARPRSWSRP